MNNHEVNSSELVMLSDAELGAINGGSLSISLSQLIDIVTEGFKMLA
jgi:hypothetical protein